MHFDTLQVSFSLFVRSNRGDLIGRFSIKVMLPAVLRIQLDGIEAYLPYVKVLGACSQPH